jgi:hypothetical protein
MPLSWTCETIRLSLFSSEAVRLSTENWKQLTGQNEPEEEQKGSGRHVFASAMIGGQLSLGAIANRCDCILSPIPNQAEMPDDYVPSVGQWPSALEKFQKLTEPFLEKLPFPVTRIAFAPVLLRPSKDRLEAYKTLVSLVKSIKQPPENMQDLLFRINWPKTSTAENGLTLNRLTTWSVQQYQLQVLVPDGNSPSAFGHATVLRFELDHNTDQKRVTPFDAARVVPIYRELTNLALQNALEGEVL